MNKTEIIYGDCNRSIPVDTEVYLLIHHCFIICITNINWVIWQNVALFAFYPKIKYSMR